MSLLAVIGGSGLDAYEGLEVTDQRIVETPYSLPSAALTFGTLDGREMVFLARHGETHQIPPHRINYRANMWALQHVGVSEVIAVAAVGGISQGFGPATICIPDQLIDYTWGRGHTYFDGDETGIEHIDFTEPYCEPLRQRLLARAQSLSLSPQASGCYAATQGPRLETPAEISRLQRDGCDLVGMTGMPEAALARELGLCYACCALVVNWAAGKGEGPITMAEIEANLAKGMGSIRQLIQGIVG